jgi:PAS domain S-box-containing protein
MSQEMNDVPEAPAGRALSGADFLAAIVESSHDAMVGKTLDGVIASWNRGAERMYGYTAAEAIGQPISLIVPAHRMEEFGHILERIRHGERVEHYETERLTKTGQTIRVSLTVSPVRERTGKLIGASAVARDITHIKKAEAALAESERRYQSLIETAIHGIYRATLDGRFLEVNPALVRLLGYEDRNELLGLSIPTGVYVHAPDHGELVAGCMRAPKVQQDVLWKRNDGKCVTVRLSAHIVFSEAQATIEAIAEDVTAQREFERKLQRLERIEILGQLAGGIAHDFNNYLNVIMGHESLLSLAIGAAEDVHHHLLEIRKAAEHAAELTRRLLLLGKKEPGAREEAVNLNAVVQDAQGMLKGVLPSNTFLALDLSPHVKKVSAVAGEIQHIVVNLVLNARDAMPDGGHIWVTTGHRTFTAPLKTIAGDRLCGEYMVLCVADTGHGMDEETAIRALEPFFSTKPEGKGTGLGLPSVYATVKRYGGSLDIETSVGQGTRISIYVPLAAGQFKDDTTEPTAPAAKTVLIVDDDGGMRAVIAEALMSTGFRAIQSPTWKDAMVVFGRQPIDVCVCDLQLPDISRRELLEGLRWLLVKSRIVVISGGELNEDERHRIPPGTFLRKPFSIAQLLSIVRGQAEAANGWLEDARTGSQ